MWLMTKNGEWYVHGLGGVVYVSWVSQKNRDHALIFPKDKILEWQKIVEDISGFELDYVMARV